MSRLSHRGLPNTIVEEEFEITTVRRGELTETDTEARHELCNMASVQLGTKQLWSSMK